QDQLLLPLARLLSGLPYNRPVAVAVKAEGAALALDCTPGTAAPRPAAPVEADYAAELRRQLQKIVAGPVWTDLVNKRYMLQLQRERMAKDESRFWTLHGERYNALKAVLHDGERLLADILQGEGRLLAAQMMQDVAPGREFDCAAWEQRYLEFKARTLGLSRPDANLCTIGIYGPADVAGTLRDLYLTIAGLGGFAAQAQTVGIDLDTYAKQEWPAPQGSQPLDLPLAGFEIECKGPGAFYLFTGERGMWRASDDDKRHVDLYVFVSGKPLKEHATPANVHRRSFYEGLQPVRNIKRDSMADAKGEWRCGYPQAEALFERMKERWSRLADRILTGEDGA
ncbi:MAG TPA: hypothetical protein VF798_00105, partial [Burkholderiaceae bacterium]